MNDHGMEKKKMVDPYQEDIVLYCSFNDLPVRNELDQQVAKTSLSGWQYVLGRGQVTPKSGGSYLNLWPAGGLELYRNYVEFTTSRPTGFIWGSAKRLSFWLLMRKDRRVYEGVIKGTKMTSSVRIDCPGIETNPKGFARFMFNVEHTNGQMHFYYGNAEKTKWVADNYLKGIDFFDDQWHHIVITKQARSDKLEVYVDGSLKYMHPLPCHPETSHYNVVILDNTEAMCIDELLLTEGPVF